MSHPNSPASQELNTAQDPALSVPPPPEKDLDAQPDPSTSSKQPPTPRLTALATKKAALEATLASLQAEKSSLISSAKLPSGLAMPGDWSHEEKTKSALTTANVVIKEHIALLHKYNEIKDIGQGLMGLIADKRGVRMAAVMEDFGMGEKD